MAKAAQGERKNCLYGSPPTIERQLRRQRELTIKAFQDGFAERFILCRPVTRKKFKSGHYRPQVSSADEKRIRLSLPRASLNILMQNSPIWLVTQFPCSFLHSFFSNCPGPIYLSGFR